MSSRWDGAELAQEKRVAAGLPEVRCPNCGKAGARHWVPESLEGPGRWVCGDEQD